MSNTPFNKKFINPLQKFEKGRLFKVLPDPRQSVVRINALNQTISKVGDISRPTVFICYFGLIPCRTIYLSQIHLMEKRQGEEDDQDQDQSDIQQTKNRKQLTHGFWFLASQATAARCIVPIFPRDRSLYRPGMWSKGER